MASNIGLYGAFLHNYARATDTVRRCSAHSTQFGEITRDIRLRGFPKGPGLSLEDLLHKPVARVQKNALVLHVNMYFIFYNCEIMNNKIFNLTRCFIKVYLLVFILSNTHTHV